MHGLNECACTIREDANGILRLALSGGTYTDNRQIDLIVARLGEARPTPTLVSEMLSQESMCVVCSNAHPLAKAGSLRLDCAVRLLVDTVPAR